MKTIKNTKQKEIGKINFVFVLFLFISFFIPDDSKAQSKTWTASIGAANKKNPLAGNSETLKYPYTKNINPLLCCVKLINERRIRIMS